MRGHYEIELSDGNKVPLRFCTWSLKRFCQLQGIGPSEIGEALNGEKALDAIINLIRSAAEYPFYKEGRNPDFKELDVCDWLDDMGGISSPNFQEIMKALAESMNSGIDSTPTTKPEEGGEVKKN